MDDPANDHLAGCLAPTPEEPRASDEQGPKKTASQEDKAHCPEGAQTSSARRTGRSRIIWLYGKPETKAPELTLDISSPGSSEAEEAFESNSIVSASSQTQLLAAERAAGIDGCCSRLPSLPLSASDPIGELDAANEESFTLEPFANLIDNAYCASKSFILARVTTADPQDGQKLYYSYYDAQHINKVLFRTQPEASLLHRMRARNPLNNMPVLGDVDYFVISPESVEDAHRRANKRVTRQLILNHLKIGSQQLDHRTLCAFFYGEDEAVVDEALIQRSVSASDVTSLHIPKAPLEWLGLERPCRLQPQSRGESRAAYASPVTASYVAGSALLSLSYPDLRLDQSLKCLFCPTDDAMRRIVSPMTAAATTFSKLEDHAHSHGTMISTAPVPLAADWPGALEDEAATITYHAIYYGTDDDFLMKGSVREYFKANSVQPEDAALFTLYRPSHGLDGSSGARDTRGGRSQATGGDVDGLAAAREPRSCFNFCGLLSNRSATWRRNIMGGIVVLYIIVSVIVVLMGIPESLRGLVGISLLVLLALMIIIFIDTERTHSAAESIGHLPPV